MISPFRSRLFIKKSTFFSNFLGMTHLSPPPPTLSRNFCNLGSGGPLSEKKKVQSRVHFLQSIQDSQGDQILRDISKDPDLAGPLDEIVQKLQTSSRKLSDKLDVSDSYEPPSSQQLRMHALNNAVPFIAFGFLDNSIMLLMGDFFDMWLGSLFGISTLAAAALGNTVGDICGIWMGGTIEAISVKLGLPDPRLSAEQRRSSEAALAKTIGSVVGVFIGCILGMFPLLWPRGIRLWPQRLDTSSGKKEGKEGKEEEKGVETKGE